MRSWPKLGADGSGGVPAGLDAISVDFYDEHNTDGAEEVKKNKDFYTKEIYPRLHPHQQALFVPVRMASPTQTSLRVVGRHGDLVCTDSQLCQSHQLVLAGRYDRACLHQARRTASLPMSAARWIPKPNRSF